jgi:large subunit ribosomal protein L30e
MNEKEIKDAQKEGKIVTGRNEVVRGLKRGSLQKVFYTENCSVEFNRELEYYGKISKAPIEKFEGSSASLGQMCGKPFRIVTLGIEK